MKPEIFEQVMDARAQRKAVALVTALDTGKQRVVARDHAADDILAQVLDEAFRFDRSGVHKIPEGEFFVHIHNPPLRLIVIGAVHIAQALIPIAKATGYDIVVIDPRGAFATGARFPDITLHAEWPDRHARNQAVAADQFRESPFRSGLARFAWVREIASAKARERLCGGTAR